MKTRFYIINTFLLLLTIAGTYYMSFFSIGTHENVGKMVQLHAISFFILRFLINCVAYLNILILVFLVNNYFSNRGIDKALINKMRWMNFACFVFSSVLFIMMHIWKFQ